MTEAPHPRRRSFGPVLLLGVLSGVALAVAGTQPGFAFATDDPAYTCEAPCVGVSYDAAATVSGANALALVALACWGVVLVARGRFRRIVAWLGLVASVGGLVAVVVAYPQIPDDLRELAAQYNSDVPDLGTTGWFWVGAVAALGGVAAWAVAVRHVRHWPEMGTRYDTPTGGSSSAPGSEPTSDLDLWKVMDEGRDPTS